jgi:hypothetical protein
MFWRSSEAIDSIAQSPPCDGLENGEPWSGWIMMHLSSGSDGLQNTFLQSPCLANILRCTASDVMRRTIECVVTGAKQSQLDH